MSWQDEAKKTVERMELDHFLEAYEHATGQDLGMCIAYESPDFICERPDGRVIGLELTKVVRDRDIARMERTVKRKETMGEYEMLEFISWQLERKEQARAQRYVKECLRPCSCCSSSTGR